MSGDYMESAPTEAKRASLRDLLQSQINAMELAPLWLWKMEFTLHVWPLVERFYRDGDPEAKQLVTDLKQSTSVFHAMEMIREMVTGSKEEETAPW